MRAIQLFLPLALFAVILLIDSHMGCMAMMAIVNAAAAPDPTSIYDFTVKDDKKQDFPLSQLKGKAVMIMNVASQCGFTKSGYTAATELYDKYKDKDFTVLAFPCNQFGGQEPGTECQIKEFASKNFKADFPVMAKIDVNGEKAIPLFNFLKRAQPGALNSKPIKWNFTSFLTDKKGKPVKRYKPGTSAATIEGDLLSILEAGKTSAGRGGSRKEPSKFTQNLKGKAKDLKKILF